MKPFAYAQEEGTPSYVHMSGRSCQLSFTRTWRMFVDAAQSHPASSRRSFCIKKEDGSKVQTQEYEESTWSKAAAAAGIAGQENREKIMLLLVEEQHRSKSLKMLTILTAAPPALSPTELVEISASTPSSFEGIAPLLRHFEENVQFFLDPPFEGFGENGDGVTGGLYITEGYAWS